MTEQNKPSVFTKEPVVILLAVVCTFLWGSAMPCIKIGYELFAIGGEDTFGKIVFAGVRFMLAGGVTILVASLFNRRWMLPNKRNIAGITLLGLVMTSLQYILFYIGLSHTTGVKGSILGATSAFFAVLAAHFLYKNDRLTLTKTIGCIIGFAGVFLINIGGGDTGGGFTLTGEGFLILAAAAFASGSIISKSVTQKGDPMMITGWQLLIGGTVLLALGVACGGGLPRITSAGVGMLLYLAALSATAFTGWTVLLKHNGVGKMAVYNFLTPIFGVLLSAILLQESFFSVKNLTALVLVCAGIYVVNRPARMGAERLSA